MAKYIGLSLTGLFWFGVVSFAFAEPAPGDLITAGHGGATCAALTFDDGPGPYTDKVLKLLAEHGVRATFFMLGKETQKHPELAAQVAKAGHEIASHMYHHQKYPRKGGAEVEAHLKASMADAKTTLQKYTGVTPKLARMPHGVDAPWIRELAKQNDLVLVNWGYGVDWHDMTLDEMKRGYAAHLRPGVILLLHDGGNQKPRREKTLAVVQMLLKIAAEKKLCLATVGELIAGK